MKDKAYGDISWHAMSRELTIDETLFCSKHIDNISKKISSGVGALKRVRSFINTHSATKIYQTLIEHQSRFDASAGPLLDGIGFRSAEQNKRQLSCSKHLTIKCPYMQDMFSARDFYYNIRRSENILHVLKSRSDYLKKRSLGYSGPVLYWNGVPSELRKPLTLRRL